MKIINWLSAIVANIQKTQKVNLWLQNIGVHVVEILVHRDKQFSDSGKPILLNVVKRDRNVATALGFPDLFDSAEGVVELLSGTRLAERIAKYRTEWFIQRDGLYSVSGKRFWD